MTTPVLLKWQEEELASSLHISTLQPTGSVSLAATFVDLLVDP